MRAFGVTGPAKRTKPRRSPNPCRGGSRTAQRRTALREQRFASIAAGPDTGRTGEDGAAGVLYVLRQAVHLAQAALERDELLAGIALEGDEEQAGVELAGLGVHAIGEGV